MLVHDRVAFLGEAFDSLRAQGVDLEVVVADTSSGRSLEDAVRSASRGLKCKYVRLRREFEWPPHIGASWNTAVYSANGDHIAFLDDDDVKEPAFSSRMLRGLDESGTDIALCRALTLAEGEPPSPVFGRPTLNRDELIRGAAFSTTGQMLLRRRVFDCARFDESLPVSEDYDFLLQLAGKPHVIVDEPLARRRVHAGALSSHRDVVTPTQVALRRLLKKHGEIDGECSRCRGPVEPDPGHCDGGWHWKIRYVEGRWNLLCGKNWSCS